MVNPAQIPIRATTQEHLDIEEIRDDLVLLKNGGCCLILQTSAVNFGLLSETEQDATIFAYAGLLNSLSFPIQIVVRSQKKDVSNYLSLLKQEEIRQKNPRLAMQMRSYREFVEKTVREKRVLDKRFYIVIPFSSLELGVKNVNAFLPSKKRDLPFPKDYILQRAKTVLLPKRDHILRLLNKIGLKAEQLSTQKLIELFYRIYNPISGNQQVIDAKEYVEPMVQPALEKSPTPSQAQQKPGINTPSQTIVNTSQTINNSIPALPTPTPQRATSALPVSSITSGSFSLAGEKI